MLIFIILSFLHTLCLGTKRISVKLIQNSPSLCMQSTPWHTCPDVLQPKIGVLFFMIFVHIVVFSSRSSSVSRLTLFYLQDFLFSGNTLMLRTANYTYLLGTSTVLSPLSPPLPTFSKIKIQVLSANTWRWGEVFSVFV